MKIYIVYFECEKWNDNIEFLIVRAKTRNQVKDLINSNIFWHSDKSQEIKKIRILGFSLKNKKREIIVRADLFDA